MPNRSDAQRLRALIDAWHPGIRVTTPDEDHMLMLLANVAIETQHELLVWSVTRGLRDGLIAGAPSQKDTEHPAAALYSLAHQRHAGRTIVAFLDLGPHLKDERTLRLLREVIDRLAEGDGHAILIDHCDTLPDVVKSLTTPFQLSLPGEKELEEILKSTLRSFNERRPVRAHVSRRDIDLVIRNLRGLSRRQARQVILDAVAEDGVFDQHDVNHILANKRRQLAQDGLLEYIESPVTLDEIGGLTALKAWLEQRQNAFSDEAEQFGITPPRGVLMLGVQGAGKSLAAKAVATAWKRPLMRLDVGALYDRYIGESERRLRECFAQAEAMAPIVLWIDEIEKAFAAAAAQSSDGGLSKRMFGSLLTWMQEHTAPVFLIATANDIEALPPELLRKGRFDEIFFVDLPTPEARKEIIAIHLRKRKRDPAQFDLDALVQASEGFSGAEIEQAVIAALHDAYTAKSELTTDHVRKVMLNSPPLSITMAERVHALRNWATGRCVPAD